MTRFELSPTQQELLRGLPTRFPPHRIDRLWIFAPHLGKSRESGFVVLSLLPDQDSDSNRRTLVTVRYEAGTAQGVTERHERVTEEGSAPPERIERVIAGVLARSGANFSVPLVEGIEGSADRWSQFLERLGLAA